MVRIFLFVFLLPFASQALDSVGSHSALSASHEIFLGAGEALGFPGSLRYRSGDIEGGFMNSGMLGAAKQFRNPFYPSLYTELGMGISPGVSTSVPGLFGAMGGKWQLWGVLWLRAELNIVGAPSSYVKGGALVGISFVF